MFAGDSKIGRVVITKIVVLVYVYGSTGKVVVQFYPKCEVMHFGKKFLVGRDMLTDSRYQLSDNGPKFKF